MLKRANAFHAFLKLNKPNGGLVPHERQNMKHKIITTLIECTLAIVIFGGIGVLLAWRG
jgi:hypothetical protein